MVWAVFQSRCGFGPVRLDFVQDLFQSFAPPPLALRDQFRHGEPAPIEQRVQRRVFRIHAPILPGFPTELLHSAFSRYLEGMEVHFPPDIETRLQQLALANGKDAEQLVKDTVARMLEDQARFVAGVEKGIAAADRGELIDHEDVVKRINRLFEP